jgi:hypothetical protein
MKLISILCSVFLIVACGNDGGGGGGSFDVSDIEDQALSGTHDGESWTFVQGETNDFLSDEDSFFVQLYDEAGTACDFETPSGTSIILRVPKEVGSYGLSFTNNGYTVTFAVPPGNNYIATEGVIDVREITATTVTFGLIADYDSDHVANGVATADICDD